MAALMLLVALVPLAGTTAADAPPGWGPVTLVGDELTYTTSADEGPIAVAPDGRALVAIEAYDQFHQRYVTQLRMYEPGSGWSPIFNLGPNVGVSDQWDPVIAVMADGGFLVAFEVDFGTSSRMYASRWTPQDGWSPFMSASSSANDIAYPTIAADAQGNAMLVWRHYDGTEFNVTARRYTAAGSWEAETTLDSETAAAAIIEVAMDDAGNAICVWYQSDGSFQRAYANRYSLGSGWGGTPQIVDGGAFDTDLVNVAMDPEGVGMVIMDQYDGTTERTLINKFTPGSGWGTATAIDADDAGTHSEMEITSIGGGGFVAAWAAYNDSNEYQVYVASYSSSGGWGTPMNMTPEVEWASGYRPVVASNGDGTAVLAFYHYNQSGNYHVRVASMSSDGEWTVPTQVDMARHAYTEGIACARGGDTCWLLMEIAQGSSNELFVSRFMWPDMTAPSLALTGPEDTSATDSPSVVVSGTAEAGSTVVVNGIQAYVSPGGEFSLSVALAPGANTIDVTATDAAGNVATSSVTVTYNDPVPALEAALANSNAEIDQLQTELDATKEDLAHTESDLTAAEAKLVAAQALDTTHTENIDAAAGSASTAMMVGLIGLIAGLAAIAMAFLMRRKGGESGGGGGGGSMVPPPEPSPPPAAEPPKSA